MKQEFAKEENKEDVTSTGTELYKVDLQNICQGAGFFASGGGGELKLMNALIDIIDNQPYKPVLIDADNIADNEWVSVVAMAGAPSQFDPKTLAQYAPIGSVDYLQNKTGNNYKYITPIEIGANTIIPLLVSAQTGKQVIDCTGTPRAVPKLQDTAYFNAGIPIIPVAFANDKKDITKTYLTADGADKMGINVDGMMGGLLSTEPYNSTTGFCGYQMKTETLKGLKNNYPHIMNTISMAMELGKNLKNCQEKPFETIKSFLQTYNRDVYELVTGIIIEISNQNNSQLGGRFDYMTVKIKDNAGIIWKILSVNENLLAYKGDILQVMGPDLISYVDRDGNTYSNADLVKGAEIILIGTQATPEMRKPEIIADFLETIQNLDSHIKNYIDIETLQS